MKHKYWVYIITNKGKTVLYTGVTRDLKQRQQQHLQKHLDKDRKSFTGRYHCHFLVYYEEHKYILNAIAREKEIKDWSRSKKIELIESLNPEWNFLEP